MNYYDHHIGDYVKKTSHLSPAALGVYQRFIDWCYAHEKALPLRMKDLYQIAHAMTKTDREAVDRALELFEMTENGYEQPRIASEISSYLDKKPERAAKKLVNAARQQRYREIRSELYKILALAKIHVPFDIPNSQLEGICLANGLNLSQLETRDVTPEVTRDVPIKPAPNPQSPQERYSTAVAVSQRCGRLARLAMQAGVSSVNPSDPRLASLLDAGLTDLEMQIAAAEAAAKSKGWSWLLATIKGRRDDASRSPMPLEPLKTYRQRANEAKLREWVPELFENAPGSFKAIGEN